MKIRATLILLSLPSHLLSMAPEQPIWKSVTQSSLSELIKHPKLTPEQKKELKNSLAKEECKIECLEFCCPTGNDIEDIVCALSKSVICGGMIVVASKVLLPLFRFPPSCLDARNYKDAFIRDYSASQPQRIASMNIPSIPGLFYGVLEEIVQRNEISNRASRALFNSQTYKQMRETCIQDCQVDVNIPFAVNSSMAVGALSLAANKLYYRKKANAAKARYLLIANNRWHPGDRNTTCLECEKVITPESIASGLVELKSSGSLIHKACEAKKDK